jgi:predicted negative regulator of RcsB-dependent stress response
VARITRKELKTDKFAQDVGLTVDFFEEHRKDVLLFGGIAVAVALLAVGYFYYARHQHAVRQAALYSAMQAENAPVGQASAAGSLSFPNEQAKSDEVSKRFLEVASKYSGSDEGRIAKYYLGCNLVDQGKLTEAEKALMEVASNGGDQYGSLAKLALAEVYFSDARADMGEKTLRDLMDRPTLFVTKDQAALALARALLIAKPAEARKLLQPLLSKTGGVGQVASGLNSSIPE